jgi:hypothetical protein
MKGKGIVRAWKKGVISSLLKQGFTYEQAKVVASSRGALLEVRSVDNLITALGKQYVCNVIIDANTGLTYHAIGTDNTTPLTSDTTLGTETARKLYTSRTRSGNVITLSAFYTAAESTYAIEECGVFGGSTASATPDSGVLFSHYLLVYDNTAGLVDLTFDYELTITA